MFGSKKLKNVSQKLKSKSPITVDGSSKKQSGEITPPPVTEESNKSRGLFGKSSSSKTFSLRGALESPKVTSGCNPDNSSITSHGSSSSKKLYTAMELNHYGLRGKAVTAAFDYTQSLLAVATEAGEIHVFGKQQVEVTFVLKSPTKMKFLRFVKGVFLVAIDQKNVIMIFSLYSKRMLSSLFSPGQIECIETDPTLDWLFLGFHNGLTMIYDVDHDSFSVVKIENLQKIKYFPTEGNTPVKSIQWNPRDVGTILISYNYVTVVYSLIDEDVKQHFIYDLPPYAPGGEYSETPMKHRRPKVIQSLYHPNSLHIMTLHEDNSMVFWDANTGQLIQARTIFETDVHIKQNDIAQPIPGIPKIKRAAWICHANPEYTSLLIFSENEQGGTFTMIDLGGTPLYSLTTYEGMSKYYANTKNQKLSPLEKNFPVVDFIPIPRKSPHFSGCHDPGLILILLANGEMETMMYPSGLFTYKATLFPQTLSWIRPYATTAVCTAAPRKLWFGMMTAAKNHDGILKGGMPVKKDFRVSDIRSALATGHSDGSIRIWDAAHNELSESSVFEVSLSRILNKSTDVAVEKISFAAETLELAAATLSGEVVLFKFEVNQFYDPEADDDDTKDLDLNFRRFSINDYKTILIDVRERSPEKLKQGFMPALVINSRRGRVSMVKNSNVGFVCVGHHDGTLMVVDRRGPIVTFIANVNAIPKINGSYVTCAEFGTMEFGHDGYSSVLLFCGTNTGDLVIFKLIPNGKGTFDTHCVESVKTNSSAIFKIDPFSKETGRSCVANMSLLKELSTGVCVHGCVILSSSNEIRVISPGKSSEHHKSFKSPIVASSLCFIPHVTPKGDVSETADFVTLQMNGEIRIMSVPDLKEHVSTHAPVSINPRFAHDCYVLRNGDIFLRLSMSESSLLSVVNNKATGFNSNYSEPAAKSTDMLYNPTLQIPFRPQVNSLQWARGTTYCTSDQIDQLLGGDNRPPPKYDESKLAYQTISKKPDEEKKKNSRPNYDAFSYQKPVKGYQRRGQGQNYFKDLSRAWEHKWDDMEDKLNDYAADMSEGLNEMFEETTRNMTRGAFGI